MEPLIGFIFICMVAVTTVVWLIACVVSLIRDAARSYGVTEYRLDEDGYLVPTKWKNGHRNQRRTRQ